MKRWFTVAVLVILVVALGILTQGVRRIAPTEDQEQQDARAAQQARAEKAPAPKPQPAAAPAGGAADGAAGVPPEESVGAPAQAKHHVEVGWVYTDTGEPNPEKLAAALAAVRDFAQKSGGTVSAEIVDLDVPAEDRSPAAQGVSDLGVTVDGQTVLDMNPAEAPPGAVATALAGSLKP